MKLDKITYQKLLDLKILDVADKLQLKYSSKGSWRKALCFCHDDHTPSLGINPSRNQWKCFSCGKGGSHIDLVMEHENLSFNDACEWLICEFNIPVPQQETRKSLVEAIKSQLMNYKNENVNENENSMNHKPSTLNPQLLERFKGTSNEFTRALVSSKILTPDQMRHAAELFHFSTADDNVIFWQIDRDNHIREGKVMYYQADAHRSHSRKPVTVSWLLKQQKQLPDDWKARNCLFGLHQLSLRHEDDTQSYDNDNCIIAIVESEKTAIICSELIPTLNWQQSINHKPSARLEETLARARTINLPIIWMATGGKSNLNANLLQPLKGMRIILFPDTDAYTDWLEISKEITKQFGHPVTVSNLLERHATDDQKKRKIDIADFLIESRNSK